MTTIEQLLQRFKKDSQEGSGISHDTLILLKKFLQDIKSAQSQPNNRQSDLFTFKEKMIGQIMVTLIKCQPSSKDKILMLEILERDLISTKHNVNLFNKLYHFLIEEDETVAIQASKTIDALIKQINEGTQSTPGATALDLKNHYIKLFEFLKEKTEFLLNLQTHVKGDEFKVYRRQTYEERQKDKDKDKDRERDKEKEKKDIVFKNNKSLKFINQVPHLFIHLMAYVDTNNRGSEEDQRIKQLIRESIKNIIEALRKTPYEEFYNEFNYDFNNELFGVMTKLLQFLFINLRTDKDSSSGSSSAHRSNQNLKKNIADQTEYINIPQVISNFILLLKNCSEDFQLNRYEIVNRLRLLLTNLEKTKLKEADAIGIMNQILDQEIIFGRKKVLGDYSKNAICSYWVEIIKSPVLIYHAFPSRFLSIRMVCQNSTLTEDSKEIADCFNMIEKLVQQALKTIFDNSIYPSVQEKCIELVIFFIDQLFPQGPDQGDTLSYVGNSNAAKKVHTNKIKVMLKIQSAIALKFESIKEVFEEIDEYVTKKLGHQAAKGDLPEPQKLNHMNLSLLNIETEAEDGEYLLEDLFKEENGSGGGDGDGSKVKGNYEMDEENPPKSDVEQMDEQMREMGEQSAHQKHHQSLLSSSQSDRDRKTWKKQFIRFIENYDSDIDDSLLTLTSVQNRFLVIYEEDDELCFNSHPVKLSNYTLYMKEVKTKLLQKCINISHKITKIFLIQNLQSYTPTEQSALKNIYYVLLAKRSLTGDQCKILSSVLRNGLRIFQILHNYDLHSDDQANKKGHLKNFMLVFAQIYDPVNFRDIFEPNMNEFFRNLIIYAKNCSEYCLQHVLIEPYCSNSQNQTFNKNIVELLTYNLILRLESTTDQLDPFHEFYEYKQEYFLLLQKLIRFPFRCLSRYSEDSFIRNYFRQIILFLTKKAHTSRFCLDYLHLMRTLFKNILFNSNRESASPLFQEFYAICCKTTTSSSTGSVMGGQTSQYNQQQLIGGGNSSFLNVNILENFLKFFNTGIPELADIVTELIIMLPLKSKHIIQFAKQGFIVKPLLHCLCLMSDYNYLLRTLKTFEIIISHSTAEEIGNFLEGVKEKLINRLFEIVISEYKYTELKPEKINNDLSSLSLKLLAKLGCLSRNRDLTLSLKRKEFEENSRSVEDKEKLGDANNKLSNFEMVYDRVVNNGDRKVDMDGDMMEQQEDVQNIHNSSKSSDYYSISLVPAIEYALEVFHKLLDPYYQSVVYISMETLEKSFYLLLDTLPIVLKRRSPLSERIISVFCLILALSSKYLTISQSILSKIRQNVKETLTSCVKVSCEEILKQGKLTVDSKFIIKNIIQNLNERVLITREDNFIKEISQEPKKFLWCTLIMKQLLEPLQKSSESSKQLYQQCCRYVIQLLNSQIIMIKNPNHVYLNNYQKDYNYVMPYKNAALGAMDELIEKLPQSVLDEVYLQIIQSVYIVLGSLPDILNLKISTHPQNIVKKVFRYLLRQPTQYIDKYFKSQQGYRMFECILDNLIGYSIEAHQLSMIFLNMVMDEKELKLHEMLYWGSDWEEEIGEKISPKYHKAQAKYNLSDFTTKEKDMKKYPINMLIKSLLRTTHNITEEDINNEKTIKLLTNTFSTVQLLISLRHDKVKYQAFSILTKQAPQFHEQYVGFTENFRKIIKLAQEIILINSAIYNNYAKIIIEQNTSSAVGGNMSNNSVANTGSISISNTGGTGNSRMGQSSSGSGVTGTGIGGTGTTIPQQPGRSRDGVQAQQGQSSNTVNGTGNTQSQPQPQGQSQSQAQGAPTGQNFNINTNTFIDDQEYGLNIEDLDIEVKNWGGLISSILNFLKAILTNENVADISKKLLKDKIQKNVIVETRLQIINKMFELIGRVDRNVRDTSYECLKQLLSTVEHPKELINNDDRLKQILRPTLISLQLEFKKFTPSFLIMFKKILKLLTQCFNITLIQKLVDKLREMQKNKEQENMTNGLPHHHGRPILPTGGTGGTSSSNVPIKYMSFSEIMNQVKCIASFLGLFQHLAYAYHNHRSHNYTVNSIIMIFKYITSISKYFTPKLGKHCVNVYIKKTLAKVFNTMCQKLTGESIFDQNHELDLANFLQLINLDESFPLREKLTRETQYMEKTFVEYAKSKKKDYYIFLEILYALSSRSNRWMENFVSLSERLCKQLLDMIDFKSKKFEERRCTETVYNERNQIILLTKILLEYFKRNPHDIRVLFTMVCVFKIRSTFDLHFLKRFLKYELYNCTSKQTKYNILMEFLNVLKNPQSQNRQSLTMTGNSLSFLDDAEKLLAVSQNIIYHLVLIEVNLPPEDRQLLVEDEQMIKSISETIKICLNTRNLYIKTSAPPQSGSNSSTTSHQNSVVTADNFKSSQAYYRNISYNYRIAIEVLQITNLMLSTFKTNVPQTYRNNMLMTVWGLLRIEDKIIKNYAFVWTSNYIRIFEGFDQQRALGLYLTLIRSLESLSQGDFQLGSLIKKSLNILIPYWDNRSNNASNSNWIEWSLKAVHDESNEPHRLVRFWEIVVKNHKIFKKFKENRFETQMVNSMQWLMVANNPTSSNPLIKKIASDMSFIYIEWKFKEAKERILNKGTLKEKEEVMYGSEEVVATVNTNTNSGNQSQNALTPTPQQQQSQSNQQSSSSSSSDRAAEICLNFFIKVALNNSSDKDDKQIMKRSLYLLKKTLILWPHTKKKFESIKVIIQKLKNSQSSSSLSMSSDIPLRFHYTLLNIINILMTYESDSKIQSQILMIFKLLQMSSQTTYISSSQQARMMSMGGPGGSSGGNPGGHGGHGHPSSSSGTAMQTINSIFTMNNIYLLNLLCTIVRRLVKVALKNEAQEDSVKFMAEIHQYIRDGFEYHVIQGNRGRSSSGGSSLANGHGGHLSAQRSPHSQMKRIQVEVAICFLKILYDIDTKLVENHLNYIKQVTSSLKKMFEKGFETSSKNNNPSRVFQLPPLTEDSFKEMLQKDLQIGIDLIKPGSNVYQHLEENYEKENIKSYSTRRPLFVVLIRILASKFNYIGHIEDKSNTLDIFISIFERIPDPELKIEVINILKCLFIGEKGFVNCKENNGKVPIRYEKIQKINYPTNKIFFLLFEDNNKFNEHFDRKKSKPSDQSYNINERIYEEITTKLYFEFLCNFIIHLHENGEIRPIYYEKIKIFLLYAVKVVDGEVIDKIFSILTESYESNGGGLELYSSLFDDYNELNCAEEYLQGDEIMVLFSVYLYKRAIEGKRVRERFYGEIVQSDGVQRSRFHEHFMAFLKVDLNSEFYIENVQNTLQLSLDLMPRSKILPKILKDYLLTGNYNETWGLILLKILMKLCDKKESTTINLQPQLSSLNNKNFLTPQEMYSICTKINQWGLLIKFLEENASMGRKSFSRLYHQQNNITSSSSTSQSNILPAFNESCRVLLDFVYRAYGDCDQIYGYRMQMIQNPEIEKALSLLQQRKYIETLKIINKLENNKLKRMIICSEDEDTTFEKIPSLDEMLEETYMGDISKECYKNLDKWDEILEGRQEPLDMEGKVEYLMHSKGDKQKINKILQNLQSLNDKQFPYYYGKSILNFLESQTGQNKELNIALLYSLLQWLSFPKNATLNQDKMLVKIECILELQEGEKIKQQSYTSNNDHSTLVDALTKVVQSVYTQINSWRQRMPNKNENMQIWHGILGQRIMIYELMKNKMMGLLDNVLKSSNHANYNMANATEKLLVPYTDIEWNKLRLSKEQRIYEIYDPQILKPIKVGSSGQGGSTSTSNPTANGSSSNNAVSGSQNGSTSGGHSVNTLYLDEIYLKEKQKFFYIFNQEKDHPKAINMIDTAIREMTKDQSSHRDEQLMKLQRLELVRLKAMVLVKDDNFDEANTIYLQNVGKVGNMAQNGSSGMVSGGSGNEQHLLALWRDWMVMCLKAYEKTKKLSWAQSAIAIFPFAIKYKPKKTRLHLSLIFEILKEHGNNNDIVEAFQSSLDLIPVKHLLIWLPQLIKISESNLLSSDKVKIVLSRLMVIYNQVSYFGVKSFFKGIDLSRLKEAYIHMKRNAYNLTTKLQNFSQILVRFKDEKAILEEERIQKSSTTELNTKSNKMSISMVSSLARCFSEIHIPLFDLFRGDIEEGITPRIVQIDECYEIVEFNGVKGKMIRLLGTNGKEYWYRLEKYTTTLGNPSTTTSVTVSPLNSKEYEIAVGSQCMEVIHNHLQYWRESSIRKLKFLEQRKIHFSEDLALVRTQKSEITFYDILEQYHKQNNIPQPPSESVADHNNSTPINKHMKNLIPSNILKNYFEGQFSNLDEYNSFRRIFAYQYGVVCAVYYVFGMDLDLNRLIIDMKTGLIYNNGFQFLSMGGGKTSLQSKPNPYSVRLSRNIKEFIGDTSINGGVLPAFMATIDALNNKKLGFDNYLRLVFKDLTDSIKSGMMKSDKKFAIEESVVSGKAVIDRLADLHENVDKVRKILELAEKVAESDRVPTYLKYWF